MRKLLIDTDPGTDDSIAIVMANKCDEFEVVGMTTCSGNVDIEYTTKNALALLSMMDWDIPIAKGDGKSLSYENRFATVHGKKGMGDIEFDEKDIKYDLEDDLAHDFIYKVAKDCGKLDLLFIGPLTNLAKALQKYPDIKEYIGDVFVMGGGLDVGNITKYAEFNIYVDPVAANIVFDSGLDVYLIGLNLTEKAKIVKEDLKDIKPVDKTRKFVLDVFDFMFNRSTTHGYNEDALMHDALALYAYIRPDAFIFEHLPISVKEKGDEKGETYIDSSKEKNVYFAKEFNMDAFRKYLVNCLKK